MPGFGSDKIEYPPDKTAPPFTPAVPGSSDHAFPGHAITGGSTVTPMPLGTSTR
jgi:hypothetical protein